MEREMENDLMLARERLQMQQIRELDLEELQVEEVEDHTDSSDDDLDALGNDYGGATTYNEITFNPCLASLHTYLGEVEDTQHRMAFLDGGAILNLPLFYLQGVVLFPDATLPLRVIQPNFVVAVDRALSQVDAPYTIGVVRVYTDDNRRLRFATIGTTAEIRQYRRLEDGSMNVVTRGQQRFRLRRRWIDVEGVPYGEVQIIQEDAPLRTPRDAVGKLPPLSNLQNHSHRHKLGSYPPHSNSRGYADDDNDSEESFESALSLTEKEIHQSVIDSCDRYDMMDDSASSSDETFTSLNGSDLVSSLGLACENTGSVVGYNSTSGRQTHKAKGLEMSPSIAGFRDMHRVSKAFLPYWVYQMYDSYYLAQRAADMWKQIVGQPSMDGFVKKPDLLSFCIASKIPASESTRQELLEIDGISYRLRREIELLQTFDCVRCKSCQTVIARRSDMLAMSNEGPLGAFVNPHGHVHEVMTLNRANGLALIGRPVKDYSWFPGYAWTITNCATCETQMGWLFTATNKKMKPGSFWGIRSSQVADDTR